MLLPLPLPDSDANCELLSTSTPSAKAFAPPTARLTTSRCANLRWTFVCASPRSTLAPCICRLLGTTKPKNLQPTHHIALPEPLHPRLRSGPRRRTAGRLETGHGHLAQPLWHDVPITLTLTRSLPTLRDRRFEPPPFALRLSPPPTVRGSRRPDAPLQWHSC